MARRCVWPLIVIAGSLIGVSVSAAVETAASSQVEPADEAFARVRATTAQLAALLRAGHARSATFRALVDRLEQSDVLVHIEPGHCRPNDPVRLSGCLVFFGQSGGLRVFRIIVDVGAPERRLIATIGHELHHAVEIVVAGSRDRPGTEVRTRVYETEAALEVTRVILAELGASDTGLE